MPKISIIIPVYNTSKYLHECLESVCSQTLRDIEIICINDGSTDGSLVILKEFQKKDSHILIIDQKNQGVSAARNSGLKIATGKYVGFVDSDDTVDAEFFQKLFTAAEEYKCDLVYSNAFNTDELGKNKKYNKATIIQTILPLYFQKDHYNSACNKLYLNTIIEDNTLRFPLGLKLGEDAVFNVHFLEFTNKLYYLDYSGYCYRKVTGSATRNLNQQNYLEAAEQTFLKINSDFVLRNVGDEQLHLLKSIRFINYIISLVYIYSEPKNGLSVLQKIKKLETLVSTKTVSKIFTEHSTGYFVTLGNYQKSIYQNIKDKKVIKLYFLSLYSYCRNL